MSLTEAEEQCVHTHAENAEEATGNDIGSHDGGLQDTRLLILLSSFGKLGREAEMSYSP